MPVFFTVHLPSKPEPQSEAFVYVAVADPAAWAGPASATSPAAGRVRAATAAASLLVSLRSRRMRGGGAVLKGAPPEVRRGRGADYDMGVGPAPPVSTFVMARSPQLR